MRSNGNGSVNLTQVTVKQTTALAATDARLSGSRMIGPHDFQTGTVTTYRSVYRDYSAAELIAIDETAPDETYRLVSMSPDIESNGLFSRTYSYEVVSYPAWAHDSGAADITTYRQPGTNQQEIVKVWLFIAKGDVDTAEAACRNGTGHFAVTSGYVVTDVNIANRGNGSVNVVQIQRKQLNADATNEDGMAAATEQLNAHGWFPGVLTTVVTRYTDWKKDGDDKLPDGDEVTAGGDVVSNTPFLQGNGLWGRTVVTKTPEWENTWNDKVLVSESDTAGHGLSETHVVGGVAQDDLDDVVEVAEAPDDNRVIANVSAREGKAGERLVSQTQRIAYGTALAPGAAVVTRLKEEEGSSPRMLRREWRRRTLAAKTTLIGAGGAAVSDATYTWPDDDTAKTYTHLDVVVEDHGDGAYTVVQYLRYASVTITTGSPYFTKTTYEYKTYTKTSNDDKKVLKYTRYSACMYSESDLITWLTGAAQADTKAVAGSLQHKKTGPMAWSGTILKLPDADIGNWG